MIFHRNRKLLLKAVDCFCGCLDIVEMRFLYAVRNKETLSSRLNLPVYKGNMQPFCHWSAANISNSKKILSQMIKEIGKK